MSPVVTNRHDLALAELAEGGEAVALRLASAGPAAECALQGSKLREGFVVLLPVGELLAGHDVIERGEMDHDAVDSATDR